MTHRLCLLSRVLWLAALAVGTASLLQAADSIPERALARWIPGDGLQTGDKFSITDAMTGLVLGGPGQLVDDDKLPEGRAIEFTSTTAARAQTENNFKGTDALAVSFQVKPAPGNTGANGCTVLCLYGHLEIRYRPDRKGFSLYVWEDPSAPLQLFVPAAEDTWSSVRAVVIGNKVTLTVNDTTVEGTATMKPVVARVVIGSWPGRPFLGRIGSITLSEPTQ